MITENLMPVSVLFNVRGAALEVRQRGTDKLYCTTMTKTAKRLLSMTMGKSN
jgi:hypothetical protein